ncbi:MAG TPA: redox-regulated ATPase YchF [Nitrospirae bacterium]|nr:ribosome-binding ATPase YchF [bacterium BMS3Abin06]HDH13444.1 redox-regulated ATPase YchF [Nitrospirota bacterium]HDZ01846.1 redox-regulated ATPase YchF [Nitrospirota bacterium]
MKLVITGFSNSGKTTVFNSLTGLDLETTTYPTSISAEVEPHIGIVKIPDARVDKLSSIYDPKKITFATVEYIDYLGITSAAAGGDVSQNIRVFNLIKDADAIVHVVRVFEDESIMHPLGSLNPIRDVASFEDELILGDLELVEKRLEKIGEQEKKGKKQDESDKQLLLKCKKALEQETSLQDIEFDDEEKRLMLPYQFLTTIPEIIVLNINESDINSDKLNELQNKIEKYFKEKGKGTVPPVLSFCGKIEMEIAQLPQDEAKDFLDDLGIEEPAMHKLCHVSYDALGLISFFTVGQDEVKAWTIKKGTNARKAAGKIHSDIERGFIRAETVGFDDFISSDGSMVTAKEKGLVRLEGKTYEVKGGDIINFKFNV